MRHDELFVLGRSNNLLTKLAGAKRAIDQCHRHGLALALSERQAIATSEARSFRRRTLELIDHLTFGQRHFTERHGKANIFGKEFDFHLAEAYFAGKRMVATIAALRRIAERQ